MPKITPIFITLGVAFAFTHILAVQLALYWYYPWFDIVMHFWGGILLVMGMYVLADIISLKRRLKKRYILLMSLAAIFGWEFFEQLAGISSAPIYILDTIGDITVGLVGVLVGYVILRR